MRGKIFFYDDFVSSDGGVMAPHWWLFRLYDFPVGGSPLAPGHRQALDDVILPFMRDGLGGKAGHGVRHLHIFGYASHSGRGSVNAALARERARSVANHVTAGLKPAWPEDRPHGEAREHGLAGEDGFARAVDILVRPSPNALMLGWTGIPAAWFGFHHGGRRYNPWTDFEAARPLIYWDPAE